MTIGEQRALLALVAIIAVGLAYKARQDSDARLPVAVVREMATPAASPAILLPAPEPPPASAAARALPLAALSAAPPLSGAGSGSKIDLNAATLADLEALPQIGPVKAEAILQHRQRIGRFIAVEQLLDVPGIGPKTLEAVRPFVAAGPPAFARSQPPRPAAPR